MTRDILIVYASNDESLANKMKHLLAPLEKKHLLRVRKTKGQRVGKFFNFAEIMLLLVSPEFLDSDYCSSGEMSWAVAQHIGGKTHLLPIILRSASWQRTPLFELHALPMRSITDRQEEDAQTRQRKDTSLMPTNPDERWQLPNTYFMNSESRDEMTRLALQDQFTTRGMGGVLPEQSDPSLFQRVLDVACGTGGWLIETAQTYPSMKKLIGIDVSARMIEYARAQAQAAQVDDRVEFVSMDALFQLDFPESFFDLVNMRFAVAFMRTWQWPQLLQKMQRVLRSGGVIRLTDFERVTSSHPAPLPLFALGGEAMLRAGHLFSQGQTTDTFTHGTHGVADDLARLLSENGMSNIQTRRSTLEFLPGTPEAHSFAEDLRLGARTAIPFLQKWGCLPKNHEQLYQEMVLAMQQPDYVASWSILTAWGNR